jgi:hypothetical protein
MTQNAITVSPIDGISGTILMTWNGSPSYDCVQDAFREVKILLNASSTPQIVLVDLTSDPAIPTAPDSEGASAPHHEMLSGWYVAGGARWAYVVARVLEHLDSAENIRWFYSLDLALASLQSVLEPA